MVLRELLARFDLKFEDRGFKQADRAVTGLTGKLGGLKKIFSGFQGLGGLLIGGSIAYTLQRLVTMGSDANETLNVLNEVFKQNSVAVQKWAADFGKNVGRSQFEMRELAGTLGAVINPLMKGNVEAATEMSTSLAALAVDLGSFYNAADQDVLIALRAGISGEAEPMKRFGVVLQEATLQEFAHAQGIKKKVKEMTIAEKTYLRFRFIMDNTTSAQGDALRTADGYANAIKGVTGAFKDFATRVMLQAMPVIAGFTARVRDGLRAFDKLTDGTKAVQAALIVLGGVATVVGIKMLLPFLPAIAILGALWLAIDDVLTLFDGGKSAIGEFIDAIFGIGTAQQYVEDFNAGLQILKDMIPEMTANWRAGITILGEWGDAAGAAMTKAQDFVSKLVGWFETLDGVTKGVTTRIKKFLIMFGVGVASGGGSIPGLKPLLDMAMPDQPRPGAKPGKRERSEARGFPGGKPGSEQAPATETAAQTATAPKATMRAPVTNVRGGNANVRQDIRVNNTINVPPGSSPAQVGRAVENGTRKALENTPKNILNALKQGV